MTRAAVEEPAIVGYLHGEVGFEVSLECEYKGCVGVPLVRLPEVVKWMREMAAPHHDAANRTGDQDEMGAAAALSDAADALERICAPR